MTTPQEPQQGRSIGSGSAGMATAVVLMPIMLPAPDWIRGVALFAVLATLVVLAIGAIRPDGGWIAYWKSCPLRRRGE